MTITISRQNGWWVASLSDRRDLGAIQTPFHESVDAEAVIAKLSLHPANAGATYCIVHD